MIRSASPAAAASRARRRTPLPALAAAAALPLVLSACGTGVTSGSDAADGSGEAVTITNCGRELSFDSTPTSVVGMMPSQTELLIRLGALDSLVGQAQTDVSPLPDDIADQAADIPVLSTDVPPAREDLLAAAPDLVVSPTEYEFTAEQGFASIEQLKQNGAQAYVATGGCLDRRNTAEVTDVLTDIENLGAILRVPDVAEELSQDAEARLSDVEAAIGDVPRRTVAQVYVEGNSLQAIGAGIEADIIATAGGENVFDPDAPEFADFFAAEITPEEIISRDPDAIVFSVSSPESEENTRDYLERTFPDVAAVKNDRLIAVPKSDLFPGTLGNIDAVELIAQELYPDAF
ncbi:ABC transporter substrate-binding protein [Streptomonospora nanhaiensis]|uniref:Iron complex transport system substrate-binding protein n=1 Tax=Streptomonospora nanhaiensis TaxID=1323731 RepID=A0A853BI13_9ACTN|nr:ABC transporter substrate-binding protein [Streptomonospora nanhaiensis]MBV2364175.1 ABC transporter substrate-binding protein [Streptomonospora nanhaiensis]MBX9386705.1 ABC transporter substrate-binding protein [Streptomonospora nanhaiensis]NYI95128.1 iron complex transport system substrate-binding protein [Streptomonospora nanhaiensis]